MSRESSSANIAAGTRSRPAPRRSAIFSKGEQLEQHLRGVQDCRRRSRASSTRPGWSHCSSEAEGHRKKDLWKLSKVDIRAPVGATAWPVARVELQHGERGRVTDIASAPGALDGAFAAVSQMMGVAARVDSLEMQYIAADPDEPAADGQGANVLVEMTIEVDGEIFAGRARARDILPCCVSAYIDAASNAQAVRELHASNMRKVEAA